MKVGAMTLAGRLAGAIAGAVRDGKDVDVLSCGVAATYQAVKAIGRAGEYLQEDGLRLVTRIAWRKFTVDGEERHGLVFAVSAEDDVQP